MELNVYYKAIKNDTILQWLLTILWYPPILFNKNAKKKNYKNYLPYQVTVLFQIKILFPSCQEKKSCIVKKTDRSIFGWHD